MKRVSRVVRNEAEDLRPDTCSTTPKAKKNPTLRGSRGATSLSSLSPTWARVPNSKAG